MALGVRIVAARESAALNRRYRGKSGCTNVLSFPFEAPTGTRSDMLGDLVICAPVVLREARVLRRPAPAHWAHMVVHGILHLRGYDHGNKKDAAVMERREARVLRALGVANPYNPPDAIMNKDDDHTAGADPGSRSLLDRLSQALLGEPATRAEVLEVLRAAQARDILDRDSLDMIEGVFQVSEMKVRDIMVPRGQMDVVDKNQPPETYLATVIESGHSRYPVIDADKDKVVGILLAKDLLRYFQLDKKKRARFNLHDWLRPAVFVPGIQTPERAAARVPRQPQPHGHRRGRIRRRCRAGDHRGRAGADRRRHRRRVRH